MLVQVSQSHINKGSGGCCKGCPVALAIAEIVKPELHTYVTPEGLLLATFEKQARITIHWMKTFPPEVEAFMARFDRMLDVQPFSFEIEIHPDCLKGQ